MVSANTSLYFCDITEALLHPYEVKRQIYDLFVADSSTFLEPPDVHLLVVCAALEERDQVVLKPDLDVMESLTAAVAIPGLFPPQRVSRTKIMNVVGRGPRSTRYQPESMARQVSEPINSSFLQIRWQRKTKIGH